MLSPPISLVQTLPAMDLSDTSFLFKHFEKIVSKKTKKAQIKAISSAVRCRAVLCRAVPCHALPPKWCCLTDPDNHFMGPLSTGL